MPGKNQYITSQKAFVQKNGRVDRFIGDKRRNDLFRDCVELKFNYQWSNQFKGSWLLLTERMYDEPESEKTIEEKDGVITTKTNLLQNKYYDIGDEATEHEFWLYQCPKDGVVPISFLGKGIDLIFQPGLDKEYKSGWSNEFNCEIDVTPTQILHTKTGIILAERPIEYVNSYAIFNNQGLANHIINPFDGLDVNYFHGKVGHQHAYCCYLPDGKKIWLESYLEKGIIYVKIPDYILNDESIWKAGLRIGPTFGYATLGASFTAPASSISMAGSSFIYTASGGDTVESVSIGGKHTSTSGTANLAVYSISGGVPSVWLGTSVQVTLTAIKAWYTGTYNYSMVNGTSYAPAQSRTSDSSTYVYYDSGTGSNRSRQNSGTLLSTWVHSDWSTARYSLYSTVNQASTFLPKAYFIN